MNLSHYRDQVASRLAQAAIEGYPVGADTYAAALDLGLDVAAIQDNPSAHLLSIEVSHHG